MRHSTRNDADEILFLLYDGTITKDNLTKEQRYILFAQFGQNYIGILNLK